MKNCLLPSLLLSVALPLGAQTIVNGDFSSSSNVEEAPFRAVVGSDVFGYGRPVEVADTWQLALENGPGSTPYLGWQLDATNEYAEATLTQAYVDAGGNDWDNAMYYFTALPAAGTYTFSYDYWVGSNIDGIRDGMSVQLGFMPEGFQLNKNRTIGDNWFLADNGNTVPAASRVYDSGILNSGTGGFVTETASITVSASDVASYDFMGIVFITGLDDEGTDLPNQFFRIDNVSVIPEPSVYAAIFGALALGFVIYRRRRN